MSIKNVASKTVLIGSIIAYMSASVAAQEALSGPDALQLLEGLAAAANPVPHTSVLGVGGGSVAPRGMAFVSASGTSSNGTDGGSDSFDGSLAVGVGLGDVAGVSVAVSASINSVNPADFGDSGSLALKFGTTLPRSSGSDISLGLSVGGLAGWGDSKDGVVKTSVAASSRDVHYLSDGNRLAYAWSAGFGDKTAAGDTFGAFGGLAVGMTPNFGVSVAYDGRGIDLGASFLVPDMPGLSLSVTFNDVTDTDTASGVTASLAYSVKTF